MNPGNSSIIDRRIVWLISIISAFLVALLIKIWVLQVIEYEKYTERSRNNRTRLIRDRAQRGRIVDCKGRPLATTRPSFSVYIIPDDCPRSKRSATFAQLGIILELTPEDIADRYKSRQTPSFIPRKITGNLSYDKVIALETHKYSLPGVKVAAENIRYYPNGKLLCHLLGYVGEVSEKQLQREKFKNYSVGDIIGRTGVESVFESELNGKDGYRWVEVDSTGKIKRTLSSPLPQLARPGSDVVLTIDLELQQAVEAYLEPWKGAVVVMDPRNGNVLAMVSSPGYDPNQFATGISRDQWNLLNDKVNYPLINRAIQVMASPGSVFKIVTTTAGFQAGTLKVDTTHFCNGSYKLFGNTFHCWRKGGHGTVDIVHALEGSCNVFYYQEGLQAGIDAIASAAHQYGLGSVTGIRLPNETKGFIPDREWKKKVKNELWWPGETVSVSIGQGGVITSPIQLVNMVSAVANRGTLFKPRIVDNIIPNSQNDDLNPVIRGKINLKKIQWNTLIEGLRMVVAGEHGTGRKIRMKELSVGGKTGTAQVISAKALKRLGYTDNNTPEKYRDHNWFAGFAPVEDPQVAIVLFIEHGGKAGAGQKVYIVKKIFQKWYELHSPAQFGPMQDNRINQTISRDGLDNESQTF